jgi:hypothetical protein
MPEVSRFFGIVIMMHFGDHVPPHFHVRYGEHRALIEIEVLRVLEGSLPPRALGLVVEWGALHRSELLENWRRAAANLPVGRIAPLE